MSIFGPSHEEIKEAKKKICADWLQAFPSLGKYRENAFYKIIGSVVVGLELLRMPHSAEYRPYWMCYALWENDVKQCMHIGPVLLNEFENRKRLQFNIPYTKHEQYFQEMVQCVQNQLPIDLTGDVCLKDMLAMIDAYIASPPMVYVPATYISAPLYLAKMKIALYAGNDELVQKILAHIRNTKWDREHFAACGVDVDEWLKIVEGIVYQRDLMLSRVAANRQEKTGKIARL